MSESLYISCLRMRLLSELSIRVSLVSKHTEKEVWVKSKFGFFLLIVVLVSELIVIIPPINSVTNPNVAAIPQIELRYNHN